ncbi:MAG: hypothetical protein HY644_11345 [Acidobacteria bacterium]|nr:hypothetical protein [Acidobacteriota bacterium]
MSDKEVKRFELTKEKVELLLERWPPYTYKVDNPDDVKRVLPVSERYLEKCNRVLVVSSGIGTTTYYGFTFFRVDGNNIDQDPFLVALSNEGAAGGQAFQSHHADYLGRTTPQTEAFRRGVLASGVRTEAAIPELPSNKFGPIGELKGFGRAGFDYAFKILEVSVISAREDVSKKGE